MEKKDLIKHIKKLKKEVDYHQQLYDSRVKEWEKSRDKGMLFAIGTSMQNLTINERELYEYETKLQIKEIEERDRANRQKSRKENP